MLAKGRFQRLNFALAIAASEAYLRSRDGAGAALNRRAVEAAAASTLVPGRFEVVDEHPPTLLDGAHNPGGMAALADSLPDFLAGRPLHAVVSILDDKDAGAMLTELLPHCSSVHFCACSNPRALSPATLGSLAGQLSGPPVHIEPDPRKALADARAAAGDGVVLATGSIYLIADLLRPPGGRRASML
jgi:dihydrofolate synthase/folylpolyglutamate synthase